MTTPAIRCYRKAMREGDKLYLLVGSEPFQRMYEGNPYVDKVFYLSDEQMSQAKEKYGRDGLGKWNTLYSKDKDGNEVQSRGIVLEAGIAFHYVNANPKLKKAGNRLVVTIPHLAYGFAQQMGVELDDTHYDVTIGEEDLKRAREVLDTLVPKGNRAVLCAALSTSCTSRSKKEAERGWPPNKMLPESLWNQFIQHVVRMDFSPIFLCAKGEKRIAVDAPWVEGEDIKTVAAMCKLADCVVSIDTGIGHLAQAVDANIVSICAAVPKTMTAVDATHGYYVCVDHTQECESGAQGIHHVKITEVLQAFDSIVDFLHAELEVVYNDGDNS